MALRPVVTSISNGIRVTYDPNFNPTRDIVIRDKGVTVPQSTVPPARAPAGSTLSHPTTDISFTDSGNEYGDNLYSNATMRRVASQPNQAGNFPVASYAITGLTSYVSRVGQIPTTHVDDYSVLGKPVSNSKGKGSVSLAPAGAKQANVAVVRGAAPVNAFAPVVEGARLQYDKVAEKYYYAKPGESSPYPAPVKTVPKLTSSGYKRYTGRNQVVRSVKPGRDPRGGSYTLSW